MERVIQLSRIEDDVAVIVASYACPMKYQVYDYTLRGKPVSRLNNWTKKGEGKNRNHEFQLCVLPDFSQQWVNIGNLRGRKLNKFAGGSE